MELKKLEPGRIILVERNLYDHYAVYAGNNEVIHYAPQSSSGQAVVCRASIKEFLDGADRFYVPYIPQNKYDLEAYIRFHEQRRSLWQELIDDAYNVYDTSVAYVYKAKEVLERAMSRIGESMYSILGNNCEHFAFWCNFKVQISSQIVKIFDLINGLLVRTFCQRYHRYVIC